MKTYEECKDEVAKKYGYTEWEQKIHENGGEFAEKIFKEVAQELVGEAIVMAREVKDGSYEIKNISCLKYTKEEILNLLCSNA